MMLSILIVGFFLYVHFDARGDYIEIETKKKYINHNEKVFERCLFFIVFISFHFLLVDKSIIKNVFALIAMCFTYWYIFDISLNTRRGLTADYVGKNSAIDKRLSKLNISRLTILFIKQWLFIASIVAYNLF